MSFSKPSDTFGQWVDSTADVIYGLNFTSKVDAENFEKQFNEAIQAVTAAQNTKPTVIIFFSLFYFILFFLCGLFFQSSSK